MRLILAAAIMFGASAAAAQEVVRSDRAEFMIETLARGMDAPWSLAFLPNGDMLVTERPGRLLRIPAGGGATREVPGGPATREVGQGGLMDVVLAADFATTGRLYLSYAGIESAGAETRLASARLVDGRLTDGETIYAMNAMSRGGRHFGGRIAVGPDGSIYLTTGDRGQRNRSQDAGDPAGAIIRLTADGAPHPDNPFAQIAGALPELHSIGHRNPQGLAFRPSDGALWAHEHGPRGGDEVNKITAGLNYGWPAITYGQEYSGGPVGRGATQAPGLEQPIHYWTPSIAPSGMAFYDGAAFPEWRGDLFVGALRDRMLVRLRLDGDRVIEEERLLKDKVGRVRDVRMGPDGALYLLTDSNNGRLVRIRPQTAG